MEPIVERLTGFSILAEGRRYLRVTLLEDWLEEGQNVGLSFWYVMTPQSWEVIGSPGYDDEADELEEKYSSIFPK